MTTDETGFPVDWNEWRALWSDWRDEHAAELRPSKHQFPHQKNLMADEILGVWRINGRNVELSEVVFTIGETHRYIGLTFSTGAGGETGLAASFGELEELLGISEVTA